MVLRCASERGRGRRSCCVDSEEYRRRTCSVRIGRNMEKGTGSSHGMSSWNPEYSQPFTCLLLVLLLLASLHHGSITFVSQRSPAPFQAVPDAPADSGVPPARFQHLSLWRTWKSGPTVRRCISHLVLSVSSCFVCAVNANELERLKKRFMKLDRCGPHPSPRPPLPSALCPDHSHATITLSLAFQTVTAQAQ